MFNASYKLRPDMFAVWMRLLHRVDGSVLWLREENATSTANLRAAAQSHGVDPDRLIFAPWVSMDLHMARQMQADLFLDTFPYGGHTMVIDALWAGLPVLTLAGETFVSRVASSMLQTVGLPELITTRVEDYEALAHRLATHPAELAALRAKLEGQRAASPLFDTERTRYRAGLRGHVGAPSPTRETGTLRCGAISRFESAIGRQDRAAPRRSCSKQVARYGTAS